MAKIILYIIFGLENFQCYFGDEHEINFTTGLNIITGSIASGKSKLFDVFHWKCLDYLSKMTTFEENH